MNENQCQIALNSRQAARKEDHIKAGRLYYMKQLLITQSQKQK